MKGYLKVKTQGL